MQIVPVHTLRTRPVNGYVAVEFKRYHYDKPATLFCHQHDVRPGNPLRVNVTIPPDYRISDMHQFEREEVLLELYTVQPSPLDTGSW